MKPITILLLTFVLLVVSATAHCEIPHYMQFQGKATDADDLPLNGIYPLTFRIYDAEAGGAMVWNETHADVHVENGLFSVMLGGVELEVDEDGFIQEPDKWTKEIAEDLAKTEEAYPMNEDAWKVVNYLREYYLEFGIAPPVRMLCKQTGIGQKEIYDLFPSGPAKGACKIAGLAKPTGCV